MTLDGKTIVITGASGDIGRAAVERFLAEGAIIAAIDISATGVDAPAQTAAAGGTTPKLASFAADVTVEESIQAAFQAAFDRLGPFDGLINGAGIEGPNLAMEQYPAAMFERVMGVNVLGVFLGMKHILPFMRPNSRGSVVNIASTAGLRGTAGMSGYVASKHAVIGLTRTAALEWGHRGIRVNAVCPGPIRGRMMESILPGAGSNPPSYGEPSDVAAVLEFLMSDATFHINGSCYTIDGHVSAALVA